ncbi:MAG: hypothetical protein ABUS79_07140 [Pseudomonadota bacterium]
MTASAVQAVFPPAGDALAVLYDDGRVVLHPRADGAAPRVLRAAGKPPASIAFSLDGAELAEVAAGMVQVRDVATGAVVHTMAVNRACTGDTVRFSAEGDHVLAWDNGTLCVWRIADGSLVQHWTGDFSSAGMSNGRVLTAELSVPGSLKSRSLTGTDTSDIALEMPPGVAPSADGTSGVLDIAVSPRADTFAGLTFGSTRVASLWSTEGKLIASFPAVDGIDAGHEYSASGELVLLANQVVDVASAQHWTNTAVDDTSIMTISSTGMLVAGLDSVGGLQEAAFIAENGNPSGRRLFGSLPPSALPSSDTSPSPPVVLSVSPDGARLATGAISWGRPLLWRLNPDFSTSVPIRSIQQELPLEASFSADSHELASSGDGRGIFSAADGKSLTSLPPPANIDVNCWFVSARFAPGSSWLALGTYGAAINVVKRDGLQVIAALPTARCSARSSFNGDGSLVATSGPEMYRTSDWSRVWPTQIVAEPPPQSDFFRDVQFAPGGQTLLVSRCNGGIGAACVHALQAVSDGALVRQLPELTGLRAHFSGEGNWVISGPTVLHLPTNELVTFDANATLSTFAPNGDIISILKDNTLARYCRTP